MDDDRVNSNHASRKEKKGRDKNRRQKSYLPGEHGSKNNSNVYNLNWSVHPMSSQPRLFPSGDSSFASFPYHLSYPLEAYPPLSVYPSMYPAAITPPPVYPTPPLRKNRKIECRRTLPGGPVRLNDQEYASLPPANCDAFSDKSSDSESNSKRHFSDPGIGPASSDDSETSCKSPLNPIYVNLIEEVRDLKESRLKMASELNTLRDELTALKEKTCTHCSGSDYQPGSVTEAIRELHRAAQLREDALISKLDSGIDATTAHMEKILKETSQRLVFLEEKIERLATEKRKKEAIYEEEKEPDLSDGKSKSVEKLPEANVPDAFRMLHSLEQEKRKLENELKEALAGRSEAEANTQKLERLVAILRLKINGLSAESSLSDENSGRGGTNSLERNPFVIMDSIGKTSNKSSEQNTNYENNPKVNSEPNSAKNSPPFPVKTKTSPSSSSRSVNNPSVPAKPNFSFLPKPSLSGTKSVNGISQSGKAVIVGHKEKDEHSGPQLAKTNVQVTKFLVGKAVTAPENPANKFADSSTDSSTEGSLPVGTPLPASITITGPVTDL